jgi:hypothetical protein
VLLEEGGEDQLDRLCQKNKEISRKVKVERNILCTIKRRKGNWIGHSWRRNCLLKQVIGGAIERTRRRGRKRKQLVDDITEDIRYCILKAKAPDRTLWATGFGRVCGPVVRQTAEWTKLAAEAIQSSLPLNIQERLLQLKWKGAT